MARFVLDFERPILDLEETIEGLRSVAGQGTVDVSEQIAELEAKASQLRSQVFADLKPYQRVQISRHPDRPYTLDYLAAEFEGFQELHGDRNFMDDPAIVGGFARFRGRSVMVVGHQKGRGTKDNIHRNFGMPRPEGYRKALRLMSLAERFGRPILCFIDTPGAYPGVESEERHVAEAIAVNIRDMSLLNVPIVCAVIGEGGSGGALGIAVADKVLVFEFAYYSVISPEGCAAILWKDRAHANDAAEALKLESSNLIKFGVADTIMPEPLGGAHRDHEATAATLKRQLISSLEQLDGLESGERLRLRYDKYRKIGKFLEK